MSRIRTPDDRPKISPLVHHSESGLAMIIVESHAALIRGNFFATRGILTSFYDHGRSDHTDGALAVKYLSAEVGVGRGAESLAENGGCAVNGVGARFINAPKLTASSVLRQLSI
jgi:hypothetical protein